MLVLLVWVPTCFPRRRWCGFCSSSQNITSCSVLPITYSIAWFAKLKKKKPKKQRHYCFHSWRALASLFPNSRRIFFPQPRCVARHGKHLHTARRTDAWDSLLWLAACVELECTLLATQGHTFEWEHRVDRFPLILCFLSLDWSRSSITAECSASPLEMGHFNAREQITPIAVDLSVATLLPTSVCLHWVSRRFDKIYLPVASAVQSSRAVGFAACFLKPEPDCA